MGIVSTSLAVMMTAVCATPREDVTTDRVDLIEINHFYDENGKHVFDQIIFYDWCNKDCRFHVRAWRLLKKPTQVPSRNWQNGDYVAVWHDTGDVLRRVRGATICETWTQYDPELHERQFRPKDKRRDLSRFAIASKKGT